MDTILIDGHEIRRGNFQIFAEAMGSDAMADAFYEMEKYYFTDRARFAGNLRIALETFAYEEYLRLHPDHRDDLLQKMQETLQAEKEANPQARTLNGSVKIFLVLQCCQAEYLPYFDKALDYSKDWTHANTTLSTDHYNNLKDVRRTITQLYAFGSNMLHPEPAPVYMPTPENCSAFCQMFFYLLRGYCQAHFPQHTQCAKANFNELLCPLEDYLPLSAGNLKAIGLQKINGKRFYVREKDGKIRYFLVCDDTEAFSREVDVLRNIWADDNDYEPNNIIRFREEFPIDVENRKLVFSLPSKPARLTEKTLEALTLEMKEKIFRDAIRAIASLHHNVPSYYHRDITPEAFILCSTRSGHKLFLNSFNCVKDTDENAAVTVATAVAQNRNIDRKKPYIAPEILNLRKDSPEWQAADWEKADIYSLGMLAVLIFTGGTDIQTLTDAPDIDPKIKEKILAMCAPAETRTAHI